ncbi:MBL fold metallo-hydrolase [Lentimicrobium sp.]
MDGGVAFGVVPKSIWRKIYPEDENNLVSITTRCLLVSYENKHVLFDTGMGDKRGDKYYQYKFRFGNRGIKPALKKSANLSPSKITDVIFTHLHDDHVGGAVYHGDQQQPKEMFFNARYWCSARQLNWAYDSNPRESAAFFQDNILPLQNSGRLILIDKECRWDENISLRLFNGHTRGQIVPVISIGAKTVVFMADVIPAMANLSPVYVPAVDIEPLESIHEKETFLEEACENNYILVFQHDFYHEACTLHRTEKGIVANKTGTLESFLI